MSRVLFLSLFFCAFLTWWGCKDPYVSPYVGPPTGYLVVEGFIGGNTVTRFTLTRTLALPGDSTLPTVDNAAVQVEGSDNSVYPLTAMGKGIYSSVDTLALNPQLQYRLRIRTINGEVYLSDSVPFKITPPIDSVNWVYDDAGVQIYVNTHDPANATRYYQWNYDQIYEHDAYEESVLYYDKDTMPPAVVPRSEDMYQYRCWSSGSSTELLLGSTAKLAQDVLYEQPVKFIPQADIQLSVAYTMLLRQYALTSDGYNFLSLMQKNSEALGSIFDAQPTQLTGNIHCLTNPTERVIGWVSAGTIQQQRIFIYRSQLPEWEYSLHCPDDTLIKPDSIYIAQSFGPGLYIPLRKYYDPMNHLLWESNHAYCADCLIQGGTTQKPAFWPF